MTQDLVTTQRNLIQQLHGDLMRAHHAMVCLDTRRKHKPLVLPPFPTHRHATRAVLLNQHRQIQELQDELVFVQRALVDLDTPMKATYLDEVVMDAHIAVDEANFGFFEADL
jgi:hypothetical protein